MTRLRLLPIVLFAASSLLVLKVAGLATGLGSFSVGPGTAAAAGAEEGSHAPPPSSTIDPAILQPVDLAAEAAKLAKKSSAAGSHGSDPHGADAGAGHEPSGADTGSADAATGGDGGHGSGTPAEPDAEAGTAPADPEGGHEATTAEGHGAAAGDGHEAAAGGGHGGGDEGKPVLTTERPEEYVPPEAGATPAVLGALTERREQLDRREAEIDLRLKLLEAAEAKVQQRIDELKGIEAQRCAIADQKKAEEGGDADGTLAGLVSMYENMKPKAAAQVFDALAMDVLVPLVRKMNPRKTAGIIAAMDPEKASRLTVELAGTQAPTEIVIRRDGEFATPMPPVPAGLDALPKIMPAPQAGGG